MCILDPAADLRVEWSNEFDPFDAEMSQMYVLLAKEHKEVAHRFIQDLRLAGLFREDSLLAQMVRVLT